MYVTIYTIDCFTQKPIRLEYNFQNGGTRWRSWFRHCATSRKVAGSIPAGVTGSFSLT